MFSRLSLKLSANLLEKSSKCFASTGMRGNTKNATSRRRGRRRGIRVEEGDTVYEDFVLATQSDFKWFPGANVYIDDKKTLFSLCKGTIHTTTEIFVPHPDTELGQMVKCLPMGSLLFKKCINVIPEKQSNLFKLVETI